MSDILFEKIDYDKVCQLLSDYYDHTYRHIFGKCFNLKIALLRCYYSIYCQDLVHESNRDSLFHLDGWAYKKLISYMKNIAPKQKIADLDEFYKVKSLLDFGCGRGYTLQYMKKKYNGICTIVGIEVDNELLEKINEETGLLVYTSMDSLSKRKIFFDSVIIIHVLHHLSDYDIKIQLQNIKKLLSRNSFIYLMEDYLGELGEIAINTYDKQYDLLTDDEKKLLLELNDYWSNVVMNRRNKSFQRNSFKTYDEWVKLISEVGLEIKSTWKMGFNLDRLHGIPSICFLLIRER